MDRTDAFLNGIARAIDADERAAVSAARVEPPYPFRLGPDGRFVVTGAHVPDVGAVVRLGGVRGRVTRVDVRTVAVGFERPVNPPLAGVLEPGVRSFAPQRAALTALGSHPLLGPLAEGRVAAFSPAADVDAGLDPDQLDAFRRALAVPDLLVVLGGPGSGKTRLAEALTARGVSTVDDADRLSLPDLVVRLVRVERAVLLGDAAGGLAVVAARLPECNVVRLTRRRAVPAEIAEFCARLAGRHVNRAGPHVHRDAVFAGPLAFVDTSGLPARRRRERPARQRDRGRPGFYNPVEANLLARLAAHYEAAGRDWAVVVPYAAQAAEVTARIVAIVGGEVPVRRNVGAEDFRGGDRQVVLYGFTRDRADLRRTGAALASTRAGEQLVLVGDLPALARDSPVLTLPEARGHDEVLASLAALDPPPGLS
ncbi:hypothetical protein [Saccharothrix sp.]|uniref:hypothetical protein n=1 Tax=Saccharothrix sp. TaxID=1873460 RepID=UPI0028126ACF|nr:hypothetical protein [Saccharothrix sp.]